MMECFTEKLLGNFVYVGQVLLALAAAACFFACVFALIQPIFQIVDRLDGNKLKAALVLYVVLTISALVAVYTTITCML